MNKNNFDFLRFLFAYVVVVCHIADLSENKEFLLVRSYLDSYTALTGFFIISGFLIGKSYSNTGKLLDYFKKRAKRLLPAYFTAIVSAVIILSFFSSYSIVDYFKSGQLYSYLFWNSIFLNFVQPCLPGLFVNNRECAVNGALWTIKVEVLFYIMVPILYYYLSRIEKKHIVLIVIYMLSVIYKSYLGSTGNNLFIILSRQTPGFLSYFACGFSFYFYYDFYSRNKGKLLLFAIPVFLLEYYYGIEFLRPLAQSIIIFYVAYSFPRLNGFGKHGDFSYGIYVFHFTLIQLFVQYEFFNLYNPFLVAISIVILVGVLAIFSWNFIEKPFLKRKMTTLSI